MRKACDCTSDPDIFQAIWKHLKTDGVPDQAANQMAAEMVMHGEDFESSIELFEKYFAMYKEKGYNEHAAQAMAVEAMEGREEPPAETTRFAGIYGQQ